jgi:hypothetical protein
MPTRAEQVLASAIELAGTSKYWLDLMNALYSPPDGLLVSAFPTSEERSAFVKTEEYRSIQELVENARQRDRRKEAKIIAAARKRGGL